MTEKKIRSIFIIEVLGRPPKYLNETLEGIAEKISKEKGVNVIEKKINTPINIKDKKDLFTNFLEIEFEVDNIHQLAALLFMYMPAHVEVVSPEKIILDASDFSSLFTEITRRLHVYDELMRRVEFEKLKLEEELKIDKGPEKQEKKK